MAVQYYGFFICLLITLLAWGTMRKAHIMVKIPMFITLFWYMIDAGISPVTTMWNGTPLNDAAFNMREPVDSDIDRMYGFLGLTAHYGIILLCIIIFNFKYRGKQFVRLTSHINHLAERKKIFPIGVVISIIGFAAWSIILLFLVREVGLLGIARHRSLYTSTATASALYNYAFSFTPFLMLGIWILISSASSRLKYTITAAAFFFQIVILVLMGGRTQLLTYFIFTAMVYHFTLRPIQFRQVFYLGIAGFVVLASTTIIRFSSSQEGALGALIYGTFDAFLFERRLLQTAMAVRDFPQLFPYFLGLTLLMGFNQLVPGLKIPGATNVFKELMTILSTGQQNSGYGGSNYANAAESFMNFGWTGVIAVALAYGLVFSLAFRWLIKKDRSLLTIVLYIGTVMFFFNGMDAKASFNIARFFSQAIFPIGMAGVFLLINNKKLGFRALLFLLMIALSFSAFLVNRFLQADSVRLAQTLFFFLSYFIAIRCINVYYKRYFA
ncbi:MAG: O-antigen polymerase [Bacteroidota bacterium]